MDGVLSSIVYVLPPAIGVLLFGVLGVFLSLSDRALGFSLHLAAGVVMGVVGVELMPRALESEAWIVAGSFLAGGLVYLGITQAADAVGGRIAQGQTLAPVAGIVFGVAFDMVTDGMMIAAGQNVEDSLGLLLSVGLVVADSPEAFSTVAAVGARGVSRRMLLSLAVLFAALIVVGGPVGDLALGGRPDDVQLAVLAFTAGMLVLVVVEGLVPEAHALDRRSGELAGMIFLAGFVSFALLSLYLA